MWGWVVVCLAIVAGSRQAISVELGRGFQVDHPFDLRPVSATRHVSGIEAVPFAVKKPDLGDIAFSSNEFAVGEAVYHRDLGGFRKRREQLRERDWNTRLTWGDDYPSHRFRHTAQNSKGAIVLTGLRKATGDQAFWADLHNYTRASNGSSVISPDFQLPVKRSGDGDLQLLFDGWLHGADDHASSKRDDFASAFQDARKSLANGEYLRAIETVKPFALTETGEIRDEEAFQVWNQMQAMVSGEPSPLKRDEKEPADQTTVDLFARSNLLEASAVIAELARSTRVVILNENHDTPCQRAFASRVATTLRPLGYDTLALEALATVPPDTAAELRRRGYPQYGDGFYIRDPAFGNFLRIALKVGYEPLAYEFDASQGAEARPVISREQGQALNLARYLAEHPGAKLFVYSGGGHLAEKPLEDGSKMMGEWLRELTGIDPLTIDQNQLQGNSTLRRSLTDRTLTYETIPFIDGKPLVLGNMAGRVDLQVLAASIARDRGRPSCLAGQNRQLRQFKMPENNNRGRILLQAFGLLDTENAVPIDQTVVTSEMSHASLFLSDDAVRIVAKDTDGILAFEIKKP